MFGFSWSEIIIIAVVALVVVGPKDLPRAMRTGARWVRAGQKLAREFQGHVDELVREAELDELREKVQKAAATPLSSHVEALIDPDRELQGALAAPEILATSPLAEPTIHPAAAPAVTETAPAAEALPSPSAEPTLEPAAQAASSDDG